MTLRFRPPSTWPILLALALGAAPVIAIAILKYSQTRPEWVWEEVFKFSLTVVLGGIAALFFRSWEAGRQRREAARQAIREFHRGLLGPYNKVKKVRRLLRPNSMRDGRGMVIGRAVFDTLMVDLEEAQLEFETSVHAIEANQALFGDQHSAIHGELKAIEEYLRDLLREYERLPTGAEQVCLPISANTVRLLLCFFVDKHLLGQHGYSPGELSRWDDSCTSKMKSVRRRLVEAAAF